MCFQQKKKENDNYFLFRKLEVIVRKQKNMKDLFAKVKIFVKIYVKFILEK